MNSEILKSLREEGRKVERRVKRRVGYDTSDDVDEARDQPVDPGPVVHRGARQARRVGDGGQVQQQVRRAAVGRVDRHGVMERVRGEHVFGGLAPVAQGDERGGKPPEAGKLADDRDDGKQPRRLGVGEAAE